MTWHQFDTAQSHYIPSSQDPRARLHLRAHGDSAQRAPVLFVHGATYASRLFDIPHPGASWLKATADAGFAAYALDIRGYGRSHACAMQGATAPYARASDAVHDIDDAVTWLCKRHGVDALALVGGSWGSITTALYASTHGAGKVARLVLCAPIFAERNPGWLKLLADPLDPTRINPAFGAVRLISEAETRERWDSEIPEGADWRDDAVFQALVQSSLCDDPQAALLDPPAFRAPNGTFLDLWEAFHARALYAPEAVTCPTLLVRGGADATSTRSDALNLFGRLAARDKVYVEIASAAHFASAERSAPQIFAITSAFLLQT